MFKYIQNKIINFDVQLVQYAQLNPVEIQKHTLSQILQFQNGSEFFNNNHLHVNDSYLDFSQKLTVMTYEDLHLWLSKNPSATTKNLFAIIQTSGTTSGTKYLPLTKKQLRFGQNTGRIIISNILNKNKNLNLFTGKTLNLVGGNKLDVRHGYPSGAISTINTFNRPMYLKNKILPSLNTQKINDYESRFNKIVSEMINSDIRILIAQPTWLIEFIKKCETYFNKGFVEICPHLEIFLSGGVPLSPYLNKLKTLLPSKVICLDNYIASEGYFAFQLEEEDDLYLNFHAGVFYEFLDLESHRLFNIEQVQLNHQYELVITNFSGLWRYKTGDIIQINSLYPIKIQLCGRTAQCINIGADKITEMNANHILKSVFTKLKMEIPEWTLAPNENYDGHHWVFEMSPMLNLDVEIDQIMTQDNINYRSGRNNHVLKSPIVSFVKPNSFIKTMKNLNKLGGQHKIPRISKDRYFLEKVTNENI